MSSLMQWNEDALIRQMVKDGTKPDGDCQRTSVRFLAGSGVTNAGGYWQMEVADAVCEQVGRVRAVSMVATVTFNPNIDVIPDPSHIMTANSASGGYVTLYVRTFDCKCEPKPDTPFDYHVAIAYDFVG